MRKFLFLLGVLLVLSSAVLNPAVAQNRYVYWMHGYNSNSSFWFDFSTEFRQQRRIFSDNGTFPTTNGVTQTSNLVADYVSGVQSQVGLSPSNAIFIGHSMGGIVARDIERRFGNTRFGGIITVGTPHQGAAIASSVRTGNAQYFARRAAEELLAGPSTLGGLLTYAVYSATVSLINWFELIRQITRFPLEFNQTTTDLESYSAFINQLNAHQTPMPRVAIYGSEDFQSHFRLAGSAGFQGSEDGALQKVYDIASAFRTVGYINQGSAIATILIPPLSLWHLFVAQQYFRGDYFISSSSQAEWNRYVIQSFRYELRQERVWIPYPIEDYEWQDVPYIIPTPNDGFIGKETQLYPNTPIEDNYEAVGANHFEQGQHPNVRLSLDRIFQRIDFFNTPTR